MASHRDPVVRAHCRRVAAVAGEIAERAGLPPAEQLLVRHAALVHHYPPEFMDVNTLESLLKEIQGPDRSPARKTQANLQEVLSVLVAFHSQSTIRRDERRTTLVDVVATANLFAEELESQPSGANPRERLLNRLRARAEEGLCRPAILKALLSLSRVDKDELREVISRLPVFPVVALKVLTLVANEDVNCGALESVLSTDQVLAGNLIRLANSCLYSPAHQISSIRQAVTYIGLEATRKLAIAAAFHPLFASSNLRDLWKHSLEMARLCERLAAASGVVSEEEAFLAGLVHDVGRLAIWRLPGEVTTSYARLLENGCEPVLAEQFLFGFDHGEISAEILTVWNFPQRLVEAAANHHRPDRSPSPLASVVHLAELYCAPGEAPPSVLRMRYAKDKAGVEPSALAPAEREAGMFQSLIAVAN